ncbi:hypothetical protein [Siminovitchia sp. 179-K 8D1 HS]
MAKTRKQAIGLIAGSAVVMIIIAVRFIMGNYIYTFMKGLIH